MRKYKAVLFDYDGTLMDTNQIIINSWQHAAAVTMGEGKTFAYKDLVDYFGTPLEEAVDITMKKYGITGYTVDEFCKIYREYQKTHQNELGGLFPGIKDTLKKLKDEGFLVGIVTSRTVSTTKDGLIKSGVLDYFDAIVGEEDTTIHKPNPEPCLICCKKLGIDPKDALMTGDSRFDIGCCNNAGANSIFVKWSLCTKAEDLEGIFTPKYIVETPDEIFKIACEEI